jgi:histidinol-phosphate aminotransferase
MNYYVDENIKNTERVFPGQGRYGYYRYDMNENPEGLPKEFVDSVLREITPEFLSIYPEPDRFLNKYADFIGAKYENVLTTNGSDMAIRYLLETFGEKGKEVVTVAPSFEMYWVNCSILGLKHVPVAYEKDMTIKIEKIIAAISGDTRIIVLLNPNNPVGNVYSEEELQKVIDRAHEVGAMVIIDEAYHYFYPNTFMKYALEGDNVVVLRTFSKLFSIAACRLGVIISNPQMIHYVKNARLSFDANSIALLFAERILDHPEMIEELIRTENEGKAYTLEALQEQGYECRDCRGNFIFVKPRHNAREVSERLEKEKKVLVHPYGNELLKDYIRVSVGSKEAMKIFLDAFFSVEQNWD